MGAREGNGRGGERWIGWVGWEGARKGKGKGKGKGGAKCPKEQASPRAPVRSTDLH